MLKTRFFYKSTDEKYKELPEQIHKEVYGNKATNLFGLKSIEDINVPFFVVLPTNFCRLYRKDKVQAELRLVDVIKQVLVPQFGKKLVSVRSGAPYSMPGLMSTILNVGLTVQNFKEWMEKLGQEAAFNSLFRFRKMFGETVLGLTLHSTYVFNDPVQSLKNIKAEYEALQQKTPEMLDLGSQLFYAIKAIWESWDSPEAEAYRKFNHLKDVGTGVIIQEMVFGNTFRGSTGVMFSSNLETGADRIQGEYIFNAQGEDIVSGHETPLNIDTLLETGFEALYKLLEKNAKKIENHYKYPQDIEWTLYNKRLYFLQTRDAKIPSSTKITMLYENLILQKNHIPLKHLTLQDFMLDVNKLSISKDTPFFNGKSACNGVAIGTLTFDIDKCTENSIYCTEYTTTEMIPALLKCKGIIALTGGITSHAAVLARSLQKPCLLNLEAEYNAEKNTLSTNDLCLLEGDTISLDSTNGKLYKGKGKIVKDTVLLKKIDSIWTFIFSYFKDPLVITNPYIPLEMIGKNVLLDPSWFMFPYEEFCKKIKPLQKTIRTYYVHRSNNIHPYYLKFVNEEIVDKHLENYYNLLGAHDITHVEKGIFTHEELLRAMIATII
jgi:pyruvate,orthophosphate dikinase